MRKNENNWSNNHQKQQRICSVMTIPQMIRHLTNILVAHHNLNVCRCHNLFVFVEELFLMMHGDIYIRDQ